MVNQKSTGINSPREHYEKHLNADLIVQQIKTHYPDGPTVYQLAPIDQLHVGGINASKQILQTLKQLAEQLSQPSVNSPEGEQNKKVGVLEIGCGLGGLMRLAQVELSEDVQFTGIDICPQFTELNQRISALCPQLNVPNVFTADACDLPFEENTFDIVVFQHSLLNIPDHQRALAECERVLRPHGMIVLHEVIAGANPEKMRYPVPWARDESTSHLLNQQQLTNLFNEKGVGVIKFTDLTPQALAWRQRQCEKEKELSNKQTTKAATPPLSPKMILGEEFHTMGSNIVANLSTDSVRVIEVVAAVRS